MKKRFFIHLALALVLLISTFVYLPSVSGISRIPIKKKLDLFPYHLGEWQGSESSISDQELQKLGAEDYMMRKYSNGKEPDIWVWVAYYESQTEGDIIHSPKSCLLGSGWTPISTSREKIHFSKGPVRTVEMSRYIVQKSMEQDLIVYWYHSSGRVLANAYMHRLYLIWDSIFKKRSDGALVRVYCSVNPDEIHTWRYLLSFLQEFFPILHEHLPPG